MQLRKLFTTDREYSGRSHKGYDYVEDSRYVENSRYVEGSSFTNDSDYVEGRGTYPEKRNGERNRLPTLSFDEDWGLDFSIPLQPDRPDLEPIVPKRRTPLTTLDALVQIKANGLVGA